MTVIFIIAALSIFVIQQSNEQWSGELPIGTKIQFLQIDPIAEPDIAKIHEAPVNIANIADFLVAKVLIQVRSSLHSIIVFDLPVLVLRLVLMILLFDLVKIIPFSLDLLVGLRVPASQCMYMK